ncbi:MAG TPA: toll/interleukin-1 receptor domain-containing protein [Thermoanaerobaculia bacterium]|nr:toll/interleukin-1 receptor domain-containing protein [Thermoanaerobaculia bacterium]
MSAAVRLRRFFGVDIFISHSHEDAGEYAVALASRLSRRLAVYVDRYGSEPGEVISERVRRELRSATMLVVIASPASARSEAIAEEIAEFRSTGRPILVVDVADALRRCHWGSLLVGLSHLDESAAALEAARPDRAVVRSIFAAFRYVTRSRRLWRSAAAAAAVVVLAMLGTVVVTRLARKDVRTQRQAAEQQRSIATARQISNAARSAWSARDTPPDTILLLAAESLRRSFTPEAIELVAELTPLVATIEWQTPQAFPREELVVSHDGRWLFEIPAMGEGGIRVLDAATGAMIWRDDRCSVSAEDAPPMIALSCPDGIALIDPQRKAVAGHRRSIAGERSVATGTDRLAVWVDETLEIHDRRHPERPAQRIDLPGAGSGSVFISRDDRMLAVERGRELHFFDITAKPRETDKPIPLPASVYQGVLADDGSELVIVTGVVGLTESPATAVTYFRRRGGANGGMQQQWSIPLPPTGSVNAALTGGGVMIRDPEVISIRSRDADARELLRIVASGPVASSPDRVFTNENGITRAWRVPPEHDPKDMAFVLAEDGKHALLRQGRRLAVRDLATGRDLVRRELGADFQPVGDLSADGRTAAIALLPGLTGSIGSAMQIFDTRTGVVRNGAKDLITMAVAVSPDGTLAASAGIMPAGIIRVVASATGKEIDAFVAPGMTHRLSFSGDDSTLVGVDIYYALWKHDLRQKTTVVVGSVGGKRQTQPGGGGAALVALSPDGTSGIVSARGYIERWPLRADATPEWRMPLENLSSMALSGDGKELAVTTIRPNKLSIYDTATRRPLFELGLPFLAGDVTLPAGSHDPVVIGMDGLPRTIHRDGRSAALSVCRTLGRSLSPDEWKRLINEPYVDTCAELNRR